MNIIGENIRKYRKLRNMSQDELAEAIGANRVTISKYENGGYLPSIPALERLATALRVTPSELSGNIEPEAQDDAWAIRERLRRDPAYRMLFDASKNASPEHLRAAAAMLKALEGDKDD